MADDNDENDDNNDNANGNQEGDEAGQQENENDEQQQENEAEQADGNQENENEADGNDADGDQNNEGQQNVQMEQTLAPTGATDAFYSFMEDEMIADPFDGYVDDCVDPGPWILVGTVGYSLFLSLCLLLLIQFKRSQKRVVDRGINPDGYIHGKDHTSTMNSCSSSKGGSRRKGASCRPLQNTASWDSRASAADTDESGGRLETQYVEMNVLKMDVGADNHVSSPPFAGSIDESTPQITPPAGDDVATRGKETDCETVFHDTYLKLADSHEIERKRATNFFLGRTRSVQPASDRSARLHEEGHGNEHEKESDKLSESDCEKELDPPCDSQLVRNDEEVDANVLSSPAVPEFLSSETSSESFDEELLLGSQKENFGDSCSDAVPGANNDAQTKDISKPGGKIYTSNGASKTKKSTPESTLDGTYLRHRWPDLCSINGPYKMRMIRMKVKALERKQQKSSCRLCVRTNRIMVKKCFVRRLLQSFRLEIEYSDMFGNIANYSRGRNDTELVQQKGSHATGAVDHSSVSHQATVPSLGWAVSEKSGPEKSEVDGTRVEAELVEDCFEDRKVRVAVQKKGSRTDTIRSRIVPKALVTIHHGAVAFASMNKRARRALHLAPAMSLGLVISNRRRNFEEDLERNDLAHIGDVDVAEGSEGYDDYQHFRDTSAGDTTHSQDFPNDPPPSIFDLYKPISRISAADLESRRFCALAAPMTVNNIFGSVVGIILIGVISHQLGSESMVAYTAVNWILTLTLFLAHSINDSEYPLVTHALGAENYDLVGQYVQITIIFNLGYFALISTLCWLYMHEALTQLGFSENVCDLGDQYTRISIFQYLAFTIFESYAVILDVAGYENFNALLQMSSSLAALIGIICTVTIMDVDLVAVGWVEAMASFLCLMSGVGWATYKQWLGPFWHGMIGTFAVMNLTAVKKVIKTGVVLALGYVVSNLEWELLTFFAAYHGPAETSAWIILGSVWELVEASTSGLGEAASIRVAFHLGNGDATLAKVSACTCLLFGAAFATTTLLIVLLWGSDLAAFFTSDETLQYLLSEVIPLIAFGNLSMVFGVISTSLIEAQGRFRLAMTVSIICIFCVTLPTAAIMTFVLDINLEGLAGAVIMGYITSGTAMTYFLVQSDWDSIAARIQAENAPSDCETSLESTVKCFSSGISSSPSKTEKFDLQERYM